MKPWQIMRLASSPVIGYSGRIVELVSYPTPGQTIMVRMTPSDPMSMVEIRTDQLETSWHTDRQNLWMIQFDAHGQGHFPRDMMHVDECDPLNVQFDFDQPDQLVPMYQIWDHPKGLFRYERWKSFDWRIDNFKNQKLEPK